MASVGSVFGSEPPPTSLQDFATVIAIAAALVTLGTLLFGIVWSCQRHGPEADFARAEAIYRDRLRQLARTRASIAGRKGRIMSSFLVALITIGAASRAPRAADCPGSTVVALLDATTAYDDIDRAAIIPAIEAMAASLEGDQRLLVRTVSDSAASSQLLLDTCVPAKPSFGWNVSGIWVWLTASPTAAEVARQAFFADLRDAMLPVLHGRTGTKRTALVDTIHHVCETSERMASLWLFSDLLESALVEPSSLRDSSRLLRLEGVNVHVAGVGRFHDRKRRLLTLEERDNLLDNWRWIIAEAGGRLDIRSPRTVP